MDIIKVTPDNFDSDRHFYPKALNSQLHSMVNHFFNLTPQRIINRYTHLNPKVSKRDLEEIFSYQSQYFFWGGSDLFYVTTEEGQRKMVVLETNSCPSGQKSMLPKHDADEYRGYKSLLEESFIPQIKKRRLPTGVLAVIYDKNEMETTGYAQALADLTGESVYLIPCFDKETIKIENSILHFEYNNELIPIKACLRYVTQKPWNRIPVSTKTFVYNSTLVCLSGGRNKLMANKAYELYNSEISESGLKINMPETVKDLSKIEIPLWVKKFGGKSVIKNPYSNAGQGVYTITSDKELDDFMRKEHEYDQFIVQSLIGHYNWSSLSSEGKYFHVGTVPNKKGNIYIADLRMMIYSTRNGFRPCALYARRARSPLTSDVPESSWDVLGTNLSENLGPNKWSSDTSRLMLMDRKDFNSLGLGLDDLIEAYVQTTLSIIAIDKMAKTLINNKGRFRYKLFTTLDNDPTLINEILRE